MFGGATICHRCVAGLYAEGRRDYCRECWAHSSPNAERSFCECDSGSKLFTERAAHYGSIANDVMLGHTQHVHSCVDIDECMMDNGGCDKFVDCINESPGRSCAACPAGLAEKYSPDWSASAGNMTCIARPHSGDEQTSALRQVSLKMDTDPQVLVDGSREQLAFYDTMRENLAASLGIDAASIDITGVIPLANDLRFLRQRRRLEDPVTVQFSFTINDPDAAAVMQNLQSQLEDTSSPLLTAPGNEGLIADQNSYDSMTVGAPSSSPLESQTSSALSD
eukprot:SAG31_NODE_95_length_25901_cov_24.763700_39_plen_279_part_00